METKHSFTDQQLDAMMRKVASEAADQAVVNVFKSLGIDPKNPDHVSEFHADRIWTRSARTGSARISMTVKTTFITTIATAVALAVWQVISKVQ